MATLTKPNDRAVDQTETNTLLKRASWIMENTAAYRLWQAPFLSRKFEPILRHNDLRQVQRVLDVGCGPGSNCAYFMSQDYVGIDINPQYIDYARRKFGRRFEVADATKYEPDPTAPCDFVLLNSLLHHLTDEQVSSMLRSLRHVVSPDGCIHVIDLVLPERAGIPRYLALNDRGDYCRTLEAWEPLLTEAFEPLVWEPFNIQWFGVSLWNLLYFKGKPRS